jgi:esterase/lipase superfamily enzyme
VRQTFLMFMVAIIVSSCARPGPQTLALVTPAGSGAKTVSILVATNREPAKDSFGSFGAGRSDEMRYLEVAVSIPPNHKPPSIEWAKDRPDPQNSFAVVARTSLTKAQFLVRAREGQRGKGEGASVGLFLHGYNYSYQEALFRLAQMASDSGVGGSPILFDWPSQASLAGYVADKDSVTYSRDDLVELLSDLSKSNVKTTILAHSMGSWLAMESIRQLSLMGRTRVLADIDQLVLAAPDINIDVLRKQLKVTSRLSNPIVILTSKDDKALALSRRISGSLETAGTLDVNDPRTKELSKVDNLTIVDISNLPSANGSNHDRFIALAAAYPQLRDGRQRSPVAGTGALVLGGVGSAVSAPFRLGEKLLSN